MLLGELLSGSPEILSLPDVQQDFLPQKVDLEFLLEDIFLHRLKSEVLMLSAEDSLDFDGVFP